MTKRPGVVLVPLTRDKTAKVDLCDADLAEFNWGAHAAHALNEDLWYATRRNLGKRLMMHRVILERMLGRRLNRGEEVDHINQDGLDNRRSNLRLANRSGNTANCRKRLTYKGKLPSSQYKGVHWRADKDRWCSEITVNGKRLRLGYFNSEIGAARVYDRAARRCFGEFAKVNFIGEC